MHGGAVTLASRFLAQKPRPDLILATDMLDLSTFLALTRGETGGCPCAVYFHENQITYPWSPGDADPGLQRDLHYGFINYTTALAADAVLFNSRYHLDSFLGALPGFLRTFPDHNELGSVAAIARKSAVLPLGVDLGRLGEHRPEPASRPGPPLVLWNHRWEYDKDPEAFFAALYHLDGEGVDFRLAVLGESFGRVPAVFREAREKLAHRVEQWGFVKGFADYAQWLWRADLLPVTSRQEFFGASVVQALYCGCTPLLPHRLSYPEHVPPGEEQRCLYSEEEPLVERLRPLLTGEREGVSLAGHVARYDWGNLAPVYDGYFEALAAVPKGKVPAKPKFA